MKGPACACFFTLQILKKCQSAMKGKIMSGSVFDMEDEHYGKQLKRVIKSRGAV
jgi:hypothetical protein